MARRPSSDQIPSPDPRFDRGLLVRWLIIGLVLIGGVAMALFALKRLEERRAIVESERVRLAMHLASVEERLAQLPTLTSAQQQQLRRSLNAAHVEAGQRLGIQSIPTRSDVDDRVRRHGLTRIQEGERYWVARLTHSVPYVTPDAATSLDLIGERFAERMANLDLPPFQFNVTSVLRTNEDQARLRGVNINAAQGESSHQFATTYDLHYQRFRSGVDARAFVETELGPLPYGFLYDEFARKVERFFDEMAQRYATRIGAELGRALIALETEGVLMAIREVQQPVYHVTLARPLAE